MGNGLTIEAGKAALNGFVIGKLTVARQWREFREQLVDILQAMRTIWMAGDLRLLPWSQLAVDIFKRIGRAFLETADLVAHLDTALFLSEFLQLKDLAFEVGDGFFKNRDSYTSGLTIVRFQRCWP